MSSVDNRIVNMEFNNADFEAGIAQSILSLERLKDALDFTGAVKGLEGLTNMNVAGMTGISDGVEQASLSFSNLQVIGMTAISELTKGAMNLGAKLIGSIAAPLAQIESGGKKRALNIAQARFQMQGLGLDVELAMKNALDAVDGTAYGLDAAAKAAGQLAASGVKLGGPMTQTLRGIAGVAAMTNSEFEDVSRIFTKVAGNGRVMGMELTQLSSYGLNAAAVLAKEFGTTEAKMREMVTSGKVSFEMFSQAMSNAFGDQAKKANDTFTGALMNVKSALSRIGEKFFTPYYENVRQVLNAIRPVINAFNAALTPLFKGLEALMIFSRTNMVERLNKIGFATLSKDLVTILVPAIKIVSNILVGIVDAFSQIGAAFAKVFPAPTVAQVGKVLDSFALLTSNFKLSTQNLIYLRQAFEGFFSIISMSMYGLKLLFDLFAPIRSMGMDVLRPIGDMFFMIAGTIGRFASALSSAIKTGMDPLTAFTNTFNNFRIALDEGVSPKLKTISTSFDAFADKVAPITPILKGFGIAVAGAFGIIAGGISVFVDSLKNLGNFDPFFITAYAAEIETGFAPLADQNGSVLNKAANGIRVGTSNVKLAVSNLDANFAGMATGVGTVLSKVFTGLANMFKAVTPFFEAAGRVISYTFNLIKTAFEDVNSTDVINSGFFAALVVVIARFLKPLREFTLNITGTLDEVCKSLKTYQTTLKADILSKIAFAVVALAAAFWIMAQVPKEKLVSTLYAISIIIAELVLAMMVLTTKLGVGETVKVAASMVIFAGAILILSQAVAVLGKLDWKQVYQGTIAISLLLWELVGISIVLTENETSLAKGSGALLFFSSALYIMAFAIKKLGEMDLKQLAMGLTSIAALLLVLGVFMKATKGAMVEMPAFSAGLMLMAIALNLLVLPLLLLGKIPGLVIAQGLLVIATMLIMLAGAMKAMEKIAPQMAKLGTGILLMAIALNLLVLPLLTLSLIPLAVIGQGMLVIAGMLVLMASSALMLSSVTEPIIATAAGLAIMAIAINLLLVPLTALGLLPVAVIIGGLTALAGIFLVLGVAGMALAPIGPGLLMVAGAVALLGVGSYLAGAGLVMLAAGIAAMGVALMGIVQTLPTFLTLMGNLGAQIGESLLAVGVAIIKSVGVVVAAFIKMLLQIFIDVSPKAIEATTALLNGMLQVMINIMPKFFETIGKLIDKLLVLIRDKIPKMVETGIDVVMSLIQGLTISLPKLVDAGFKLIVSFINSLADSIDENVKPLVDSAIHLGGHVVEGLIKGLLGGAGSIVTTVKGLGNSLLTGFRDALGIASPSKEAFGIGEFVDKGLADGISSGGKFINGAANAGIDGLLGIFKGATPAATDAGKNLGDAVATGVKSGSYKKAGSEITDEVLQGVRETAATISVEGGKYIADGIIIGLVSKEPNFYEASKFLALAIKKGMIKEAPMFDGIGETSATSFLAGLTDEQIIAKAWDAGIQVSSSAWQGAKTTAEAMAAAGTAAGQAYIDGLNQASLDAAARLKEIADMSASGDLAKRNIARRRREQAAAENLGLEYGFTMPENMTDEERTVYENADTDAEGNKLVEDMRGVGEAATTGLANGLSSGVNKVVDAVKSITTSVVDAAKQNLGINSPSKVFADLGKHSATGFANGLTNYGYLGATASENIGNKAMAALKQVMSNIGEAINGDLDLSPTIRPVLDLTNVQTGVKTIASLLDTGVAGKNASFISNTQSSKSVTDDVLAANDPSVVFPQNGSVINANIYVRSPAEAMRELEILNKQLAFGL